MKSTLILASSSPRRQELIRSLKLPVHVFPTNVDETVESDLSPEETVETLSLRKAQAAAEWNAEGSHGDIVVGSDTIVVLDRMVLGKPKDREHARWMLEQLQGRRHDVYSGVACIKLGSERIQVAHRRTSEAMKALAAEQNVQYIDTGEPMDKARGNDTTRHLGDIGQYRILSELSEGKPEMIVGHTVSKVTFRPMSEDEIRAYVETGEPLDKAGAYGIQGIGSVFIEKLEGDFYSVMGLPLNLLYQMLLRFGISPFKE